jgi:hypothetical protein
MFAMAWTESKDAPYYIERPYVEKLVTRLLAELSVADSGQKTDDQAGSARPMKRPTQPQAQHDKPRIQEWMRGHWLRDREMSLSLLVKLAIQEQRNLKLDRPAPYYKERTLRTYAGEVRDALGEEGHRVGKWHRPATD